MATIINTTPPSDNSGGGMGVIIGLVLLIILVFLFFYYGLPLLKNIQLGTPQINVPNKIDVNVHQTK